AEALLGVGLLVHVPSVDGRSKRRVRAACRVSLGWTPMSALRLEPFSERHLPQLDAMMQDEALLRFTRVPVPPPPGFARAWLARYEQARAAGTGEAFAVVDGGDTLVGLALAPQIDAEEATMELGYLVAPQA